MKILLANKTFYLRGGSERSFFTTARLLEEYGHKSVFFSMRHEKNLDSRYAGYFVSGVRLDGGGGPFMRAKAAGRILYGLEAERKIGRLADEERPDVAHLHNVYHQLSPSVVRALKKRGVPVVMTLHDFKVVCGVYTLFRDGGVCEDCAGSRYYQAFANRCVKGSRIKSALLTAEMYLHHRLLRLYDMVDLFISPSRFLMEKTARMGFPGRMVHLPNFVDPAEFSPSHGAAAGAGVTYFGRLSPEKGLLTLLEAFNGLDLRLEIVGEGPQERELKEKARGMGNVVFHGYKSGDELKKILSRSAFTVAPSEWYENHPFAVIESFALGKPVVGSRIGGLPELIEDGVTGLTFRPGDAAGLREALRRLASDPAEAERMGKNARAFVERELSPKRHYEGLMEAYEEAVRSAGAGRGRGGRWRRLV